MTETAETTVNGGGGTPPNSKIKSTETSTTKKGPENFDGSSENTKNATSTTVSSTENSVIPENAQLISRTTNQVQTQQVKTITKVYTTREVRHISADGTPLEQPFSETTTATTTTSGNGNNNNDYTNFPGPREGVVTSSSNGDSAEHYNAQFHDPHYSNTNYSHPSHPGHQLHHQLQPNIMAPSPSPGSGGSTANTGSTATFTNVPPRPPLQYDPYARNSTLTGYTANQVSQDYSNYSNYQDLANLEAAVAAGQLHHHLPQGASPQPPIRRHLMAAEMADGSGNFVQYGYTGGAGPQMISMANSPNAAAQAAAIYGNFEGGPPEGYLDRYVFCCFLEVFLFFFILK